VGDDGDASPVGWVPDALYVPVVFEPV
jgi:hypothetical protein